MYYINSPKYDLVRLYIKKLRSRRNWDEILFAGKGNKILLDKFLEEKVEEGVFPDEVNSDLWFELVSSERQSEERALSLKAEEEITSLISDKDDNDVEVPINEMSSWQQYRNKLINSGWSRESIDEIEDATIKVLRKLNRDTTKTGPVKGLMVGNVQSGKTANMAALMAMAADWGWNMFIVLSGIIENLRKQTERRLWNDLNHPGTVSWISLQHLSRRSPSGQRAQDLIFDNNANQRYFTVCLKNKTRLENLIIWMNSDNNKLKQMKILVIDDEADQAGVNTQDINKEERARINSLIVDLVEGARNDNVKSKAMNYISYTATPYSNFLNESSLDSLYPKDFIGVLKSSNEYFGPKQIFGIQETDTNDGMDIVREISTLELGEIQYLHKNGGEIPASLKESICWFLCSAAAMRNIGHKKPISMLVHTSQRQSHHSEVAAAIESWIHNISEEDLLKSCKVLYSKEILRFSLKRFREQYKEYSIPDENINDYPKFADIEEGIIRIKRTISPIPLGEDGDLIYHNGIHLCIDNCANNGINDDNMFVRLAYPDPLSENYPSVAPAFIIVGGSTLSRGLTIEGLVSTYFLRPSTLADSLMQMGRWFGYRKGYELFPRIWMTADTYDKFEFLATLEEELREDLRRYSDAGIRPAEVGPRIKNSPKSSWLKITSKNKMQGAELIEMDFTGTSNQTVIFSDDSSVLNSNISITESFLNGLGNGTKSFNETALVWRRINFETIKKELLLKFNFHPRSRVFNQIDVFCKWYEESAMEAGFKEWNVVVGGKGKIDSIENGWKLSCGTVGKINRSRKGKMSSHDKSVSLGVLRAPVDLYADIDPETNQELLSELNTNKASKVYVDNVRKEAGLEFTPQLLIYRIDQNSKAIGGDENNPNGRKDLNFSADIIGISLYIPGIKNGTSFAKKLTVKITNETEENVNAGEMEEE